MTTFGGVPSTDDPFKVMGVWPLLVEVEVIPGFLSGSGSEPRRVMAVSSGLSEKCEKKS